MSKKEVDNSPVDYKFPEPPKTSFLTFLYNSKENTYLGRTPKNWGELCVFYTIFYIVLAILFAICMHGLASTLSDKEPKWQLDHSIIGSNPGLGFRPYIAESKSGAIIHLRPEIAGYSQGWVQLLNEFLDSYNSTVGNVTNCGYEQPIDKDEVCVVDMEQFGPCNRNQSYGYEKGRPCVFLKLNKIYGWVPEFFNDPNELPSEMPNELKDHIKSLENYDPRELRKIWVSCEGYSKADKENIGAISFYPSRGFPIYYFPYRNQPGYQSPLIALEFENVKKSNLVNIECRAWAKNIYYSRNPNIGRKGSVVFQFLID